MNSVLNVNEVATLSTVLLTNLDEGIFFSKISEFVLKEFGEYKVRVFASYEDGSTELKAENGNPIVDGIAYTKGEGLAGYVTRLKRAYYSNSKRDPLLSTEVRDECVEKELCVPMNCDGTIIGTINIQSTNNERMFSEEDVTRVLEILSHLQAALNNMKMYLIAKNLNRKLEAKIVEAQKELEMRAPMAKGTSSNEKIEIIGHSNKMIDILNMATKIAKEDFPIMIQGESGTGKKLLAKKIHSMSERSNSGCVLVHCGAIEESRLEVELFGRKDSKGLIEKADGGTLILDNVQELPANIQAKLLRSILSGEIYNVDSNLPTKVNVRIISISSKSIEESVDNGSFREDLLYRLNIINIAMPSLSERNDDVKLLAEYFLNQGRSQEDYKVLTAGAAAKLQSYGWPGNLQELRNLMERTYILTEGKYIDETHLPELISEQEVVVESQPEFAEQSLHDLEKAHICRTLEHLNGNKTRAAKSLGITVKTLYNKLHSYGLVTPRA
ncbi:MAG: sigma 54-interacting transcriptional regulator [Bacteriovoracaceae bacterium]|jgi:Nif-specific regulatory protein|nr:sigma 54-interacting transcriptional regulator [Bacteriovoracaceae bacterium]